MKKILIVSALLLLTAVSFSQKRHPNRKQVKVKTTLDKYHDNIDNRMKGPNGEVIYIGPNGGRYYLKNGRKVYVKYKG
jgi:hypothetical protein